MVVRYRLGALASFSACFTTMAPLRAPRPVSTTSVARSPTTMPMLGKPDDRVDVLGDARHRVFGQQHGLLR